jgi:hypothetical protein
MADEKTYTPDHVAATARDLRQAAGAGESVYTKRYKKTEG